MWKRALPRLPLPPPPSATIPMDDHDLASHPTLRAFVPKPVNQKHKQFEGMKVWIQLPFDADARKLGYAITDTIRAQKGTTTNDEHDPTVTHLIVDVPGDFDPLKPFTEDELADFERKPKRWKAVVRAYAKYWNGHTSSPCEVSNKGRKNVVVLRSEWLNEVMTGKLRPSELGKWELWQETWEHHAPPVDDGDTDTGLESTPSQNQNQKQIAVDPRLRSDIDSAPDGWSMDLDPVDNQLSAPSSLPIAPVIDQDDGWPSEPEPTNQEIPSLRPPTPPLPPVDQPNDTDNPSLSSPPMVTPHLDRQDQDNESLDQDGGWDTGLALPVAENMDPQPNVKASPSPSSWSPPMQSMTATTVASPQKSEERARDNGWSARSTVRTSPCPQSSAAPPLIDRHYAHDHQISASSPVLPQTVIQNDTSGWLNQDDGWATDSITEAEVEPQPHIEVLPIPLPSPPPSPPRISESASSQPASNPRGDISQTVIRVPSPIPESIWDPANTHTSTIPTRPSESSDEVAVKSPIRSTPTPETEPTHRPVTTARPVHATASSSTPAIESGESRSRSCCSSPLSSLDDDLEEGEIEGPKPSPLPEEEWGDEIVCIPAPNQARPGSKPKSTSTTTLTLSGSNSDLKSSLRLKYETPQRMMERLEAAPKTTMTSGFSPPVKLRQKRHTFSGSDTESHLEAGSSSTSSVPTSIGVSRKVQNSHARKRSRVSFTPTTAIPDLFEFGLSDLSFGPTPLYGGDTQYSKLSKRDDHQATSTPPPPPPASSTFAPALSPVLNSDVERLLMEVEDEFGSAGNAGNAGSAGSAGSSPLTPSPEYPPPSQSRQSGPSTPSWSSSLESESTGPSSPDHGEAERQVSPSHVSQDPTNLLVQVDDQTNHDLVAAPTHVTIASTTPTATTASNSLEQRSRPFQLSADVLSALESLGTQIGLELELELHPRSQEYHHPTIQRQYFMDEDIMSLIHHRSHNVRFLDIVDEDRKESESESEAESKLQVELGVEVEVRPVSEPESESVVVEKDQQAESFRRALEGMSRITK